MPGAMERDKTALSKSKHCWIPKHGKCVCYFEELQMNCNNYLNDHWLKHQTFGRLIPEVSADDSYCCTAENALVWCDFSLIHKNIFCGKRMNRLPMFLSWLFWRWVVYITMLEFLFLRIVCRGPVEQLPAKVLMISGATNKNKILLLLFDPGIIDRVSPALHQVYYESP